MRGERFGRMRGLAGGACGDWAFATVTYASSHSNRRGFHPRIRFAFAFEAPLSFVA